MNDDINLCLGTFIYPLASVDYIHKDYLTEYYNNPTEALQQEVRKRAIRYLRMRYSVKTYDKVNLYLEKWYLHKLEKNTLFDQAWYNYKLLARIFISQRDGNIVYKYWENNEDKELLGGFSGDNKIYYYHSMNRLMPLDILVATYLIINDKTIDSLNNFYGSILVSDLQLDTVLQKGVAECHLHSGVSRSFLNLWDECMTFYNYEGVKKLQSLKIETIDQIDPNKLFFYILSANLLRVYMTLQCKGVHKSYKFINQFVYSFGEDSEKLYNQLSGEMEYRFIECWSELEEYLIYNARGKDYVQNILLEGEMVKTNSENIFLYHALKYAEKTTDNRWFKYIFMKYNCIKNYIFNQMVQQKTIMGLNHFQQNYYKNNSIYNKMITDITQYWETTLHEQFQSPYIKKIELRLSIANTEREMRAIVKNILKAYEKCIRERVNQGIKEHPQIGLVFHLLKKEEINKNKKCIHSGAPEDTSYKVLHDGYQKQILILKRIVEDIPELSEIIVGLDIASLETAVPTWVFVKVFETARDSKNEMIHSQSNKVQSLSFTAHAGEEYRHILSGIRNVDEVVSYLKFHAGDRIGHGVALLHNVDEWWKRNKTVILPTIELFDNYLWAYEILSHHNIADINIAYVERRIYELYTKMFGDKQSVNINLLVESYNYMFEDGFAEKLEWKNHQQCYLDNKCEVVTIGGLIAARHCQICLEKMNNPIHYRVTQEDINIAKYTQHIVQEKIKKQGIVIEINPSSNVSIADIDTLANTQIFNQEYCDLNGIQFCINSDDPSVFNTNATNELGYIYFSMIHNGLSRLEALELIEKIRKQGMDSSFIRTERVVDSKWLEEIIYKI